jgi:tetratricopeptide (TPR) repeat protein
MDMCEANRRDAGSQRRRDPFRRWWLRPATLACVLTSMTMAVSPAAAQPGATAREKAKAILAEGGELYRKGNFPAALARFKAAYQVFPSPKLNYNFGLVHEAMGKPAQAYGEYERFLRGAHDAPPESIADAKERQKRLSAKLGFVTLTTDAPDADIFLDGVPLGKVANLGTLPVEIGKHDIVARSKRLGSQSRTFTVPAGQTVKLHVELQGQSAGNPAPARPASDQNAEAAEQLVLKGVELRKQLKHLEAYELFQKAHQMNPAPRPTAQLGLVEYQLGKWVDAELHLEQALQGKNDPFIRSNLQTIEEALSVVRSHIGYVSVTGTPTGAEVVINGKKAGALPVRLIKASTGYAEVLVTAPGYAPARRTLTLEPQLTQELFVTLDAQPGGGVSRAGAGAEGTLAGSGADVEPGAGRLGPLRISSIVVGAAGLGGIVYGLYQTYRVQTLSKNVPKEDRSGITRGRDAERRQWLGYGVGAAALAAGGLLWWWGRPMDADGSGLALLPLPRLDGGLLALRLLR